MQRVVLRGVDSASVEAAVGAACYERGFQCAAQHAVVHSWWDSSESALHGTVHGRTGEFYTTTAYFSLGDGLPVEFGHGECSCPVGFNCKHAVALTLAAAKADPAQAAPRQTRRPVAWEQSLESLLAPRPGVTAGPPGGTPLAVELTLSGGARPVSPSSLVPPRAPAAPNGPPVPLPSLKPQARLVQMGRGGGWVNGGLSWAKLFSSVVDEGNVFGASLDADDIRGLFI